MTFEEVFHRLARVLDTGSQPVVLLLQYLDTLLDSGLLFTSVLHVSVMGSIAVPVRGFVGVTQPDLISLDDAVDGVTDDLFDLNCRVSWQFDTTEPTVCKIGGIAVGVHGFFFFFCLFVSFLSCAKGPDRELLS